MQLRTLYSSPCAKTYEVPVEKAKSVLSKLEKAIKKEEQRTDANASLLLGKPGESSESYPIKTLSSIGLDALNGNELIIQLQAAQINERTGRIDRDCLEGKDYATLQLDGDILQVAIPRQAGFALCPAAVDAVFEKYII